MTRMTTRREVLKRGLSGAVIAGSTVAYAGCLGGDEVVFSEGFEDGMGDWEADAAIGPEVDIADFDWAVEISDEQAAEGDYSLRIWNQGDYDDGTAWVVHPIPVEAGERYRFTVSAQWWSESESFNHIRDAVMRLGPDPPSTEEDFPPPGMNSTEFGRIPFGGLREPLWLADGWREYTFEWRTRELDTETVHLALGTSVVWESDVTHYLDDIVVERSPR